MYNYYILVDKDVFIGVYSNSFDIVIYLCFNWIIKMMVDGGIRLFVGVRGYI